MIELCALDSLGPEQMPHLLPLIERAGYKRYWVTEHHAPFHSGAPTVQLALAAGLTESIRVGTAAVLLPYTSPMKVAEEFRLLELYFPGRLDLGVASGFVHPAALKALVDGRRIQDSDYGRKVGELAAIIAGDGLIDRDSGFRIGPFGVTTVPEIWVCGASHRSARIAGSLGLSYAFHEYFAQARGIDGRAVVASYRASFDATNAERAPRLIVCGYGLCAQTSRQAEKLWRARYAGQELADTGQPSSAAPTFLGRDEECCEQLSQLAHQYDTRELAIDCLTSNIDARCESFGLVAEAIQRAANIAV